MASDGRNYLNEYAEYFRNLQEFVSNLNYEDDLVPSNLKCRTGQEEFVGECVDWTLRYLRLTKCPQSLLSFLTKSALDVVKTTSEGSAQEGFLLPNMVEVVNEVCQRYCGKDNTSLQLLPPPPSFPTPAVSSCGIKNARRRMENRIAIVEDLDTIFNISSLHPTNYYGLFDGHSGVDAATYCSTHMHCFIAQSPNYPTDPERALRDAFARTESLFSEKCNQENSNGGCTALCVLHRPVDRFLYTAWVGDSQAIVVSHSKIAKLVNPHKPSRVDERKRIEQAGGIVVYYGTWRVNGQLAVSRAIGDVKHKEFVSGEPEITTVALDGSEDFVVLGCDGLWDAVSEADVAVAVYEQLQNEPGDVPGVSQSLVNLARRAGSKDNISVVVVLLRPLDHIAPPDRVPDLVAAYGRPTSGMDILDAVDNANNPFLPTNGLRDDVGLVFDSSPSESSGRQHKDDEDDEDDEDDLGPETDVDAVDDPDDVDDVDDVLVSPTSNVQNPFLEKTSLDKHEVLALALGGGDDDQPMSLEPLEPLDTLSSSQLAKGGAEVENVGDSGEDSEDEWNYYRVDPTSEKASAPQDIDSGAVEDMESQLNPNAAVFIPSSPTENSNHIEQPFNENLTQEEFFNKDNVMSSSFIAHEPVTEMEQSQSEIVNVKGADEVWLSSSPAKGGVPLDNVFVPSEDEFDRELSMRPGDLDLQSELNDINGKEIEKNLENQSKELENGVDDVEDTPLLAPNISVSNNPFAGSEPAVDSSESDPKPCQPEKETQPSANECDVELQNDAFDINVEVAPADNFSSETKSEDIFSEDAVLEQKKLEMDPFSETQQPSSLTVDVIRVERSESPVVSGSLDVPLDAGRYIDSSAECLEPLSFGVNHTNLSAANEGVLYSTSGFDNLMYNTSALSSNPSPNGQHISAQSTPFEDEEFKLDAYTNNGVVEEDNQNLFANQNLDIFSAKMEISASQAEVSEVILTDIQNNMNEGFTEEDSTEKENCSDEKIPQVQADDQGNFPSYHLDTVQEAEKKDLFIEQELSDTRDSEEFCKQLACDNLLVDAPSFIEREAVSDDFKPVLEEPAGLAVLEPQQNDSTNFSDNQAIDGFVFDPPSCKVESAMEMEEIEAQPEQSSIQNAGTKHELELATTDEHSEPLPQENDSTHPKDHESENLVSPLEATNLPATCLEPSSVEVELAKPAEFNLSSETAEVQESALSPVNVPEVEAEPASACGVAPDVDQAVPLVENPIVQAEATQVVDVPMPQVEAAPVEVPEVQTEVAPASKISNSEVFASSAVAAATAGLVGAAAAAGITSKTDKKPAAKGSVSKATTLKPSTKTVAKSAVSPTAPAPAKKSTPVPATRVGSKPTAAAAASKSKPTETASKTLPASRPVPITRTAPVKTKTATTVAAAKPALSEKKTLTNGDAPKPAATKPSRPPTAAARPTSAPVRTTTATKAATSTAPKTSAVSAPTRPPVIRRVPASTAPPKPKVPASNVDTKPKSAPAATAAGVNSRPRPTATATSSSRPVSSTKAPAASKPTDKQTKESTNKLISSTRTTAPRTQTSATSKANLKTTSAAASSSTAKTASKPAPIRRPTSATGVTKTSAAVPAKKTSEQKAPLTNGVMKNGHATSEEIPLQNGVSHHEPVIQNGESNLNIEPSVDNQLVA